MSGLEALLRQHASQLNGVTLWASSSGAGRWQGNVRWSSGLGWTVEHADDPVDALVAALSSTTRFDPTKKVEAQPAPAPAAGLFD